MRCEQDTDRPFPRLGQDLRLDNRWLDLRTPANNAIMRLQSGVCQLFRYSTTHTLQLQVPYSALSYLAVGVDTLYIQYPVFDMEI